MWVWMTVLLAVWTFIWGWLGFRLGVVKGLERALKIMHMEEPELTAYSTRNSIPSRPSSAPYTSSSDPSSSDSTL